MHRISPSLRQTEAALSESLHRAVNLGVEFHTLCLHPGAEPCILMVFMQGLADDERIRLWVLEPLKHREPGQPDRLNPAALAQILTAPRTRVVDTLPAAIEGILQGATALFLEGSPEALLVETQVFTGRSATGSNDTENFGNELMANVALIRKRLRDPALVAVRVAAPHEAAATVALVYLKGKADPRLLDQIRTWVQNHAGEDAMRRGVAAGLSGKIGVLPDLTSTPWPGKTAALLTEGYVAVMVDRLPFAYLGPVTAPSLLYGPGDENLRLPIAGAKRFFRVLMAFFVILDSALIIAVMEYHPEVVPTPFLLSLAGVREAAAFPVIAAVVGVEFLQELFWIVPFRLQLNVSTGHMVVAFVLTVTLMVVIGLVGPLSAMGAILGMPALLGLVTYDLRNLVRTWRWAMMAGAAVFGLFGMASVVFLMAVYLTRSESFGVPFIAETGSKFTAPGRTSAGQRGEKHHALKPTGR